MAVQILSRPRRWIDYDHGIWLVFLGFWGLHPYMDHQPLRYWLLMFIAITLFVSFYLLAHFGPPRGRRFCVGAMFVLAMIYVPINPSAWGIYIYIAASLPEVSESTNTVIGLLLLQCGALVTQCWVFHLSAWTWSMGISWSLLVGMNRLRMEQKHRADVKLRILETDRSGPLLAATFHGRRHALTTAALLRSLFALPLVTFKIVAAIHWEALRLWVKGARLVPRTNTATAKAACNTGLAIARRADYTGATLSAAGREPGSRESALVR